MAKQEFRTFRGLLYGAICNRTQAQFAKDTGISPEHLNRMLNSETIHRPNKQTLQRIATHAKNNITYNDLVTALNEEDETFKEDSLEDLKSKQKLKEARNDFAPDFEEQAKETFQAFIDFVNNYLTQSPINITRDGRSAYLHLLKHFQKANKNLPELSLDVLRLLDYYGNHHDAEQTQQIALSLADWDTSAECLLICYIKCGHLLEISGTVEDNFEIYGLPAFLSRKLTDEPDTDLETLIKQPLCVRFRETVRYKATGQSLEERLLTSIFGKPLNYPAAIQGVGFYLNQEENLPKHFGEFLKQHRHSLLASYKDQPDKWEELNNSLTEIFNQQPEDAEDFWQTKGNQACMDILEEFGYVDDTAWETGWPAAISNIMSEETAFPFQYEKPTESKEYKIDTDPCILITDEAVDELGIARDTLLNTICQYCKELGVRKFGDIVYYTITHTFKHMDTFVVKEEPKQKNIPEEPEEEICIDLLKLTEHTPKETGVYWVKLKDGRMNTCLYVKDQSIWLARHKEWSDLVEAFSDKPLRTALEDEIEEVTNASETAKSDAKSDETETNNK